MDPDSILKIREIERRELEEEESKDENSDDIVNHDNKIEPDHAHSKKPFGYLKAINKDEENIVKIISNDKFTPEKLMTMLDKDKLEELEEEFEQHPDGIELVNFVWLMKSALKVDKNDEYDLIYGL